MNGKYGFEAPEKITQGQRVRKVLMARNQASEAQENIPKGQTLAEEHQKNICEWELQASEAPEKVHKSQTFASGHHKKFFGSKLSF